MVLVPAEYGNGRNGIYPPETPGEPRFIIGPNTLLVYEVEVLEGGGGPVRRLESGVEAPERREFLGDMAAGAILGPAALTSLGTAAACASGASGPPSNPGLPLPLPPRFSRGRTFRGRRLPGRRLLSPRRSQQPAPPQDHLGPAA